MALRFIIIEVIIGMCKRSATQQLSDSFFILQVRSGDYLEMLIAAWALKRSRAVPR